MAIPDYQTIMLPLLKFFADRKEHRFREAINYISNLYKLSEDEKESPLPSGQQPIIDNRVGWAKVYLKKAGLLEDPRRGYVKITELGIKVIEKDNPTKIDIHFLEQFPGFIEFRTIKKEKNVDKIENLFKEKIEDQTPFELMEKGNVLIMTNLSQELLIKIRNNSPKFFEEIVGKLLSSMDYGRYEVTGRSGDGGIDGIVYQDKLGLDKIFFQAKKFDENNPVSASMIRDFVGSLELKGANKGIFITTSRFPSDAEKVVSGSHKSIRLIDGVRLVQLMIEHDLGVSIERVYKIKRIDTDFFPDD